MSSKEQQIEQTQKNIILVLILGIIAIGIIGFYAFSKYITSIEGKGEAQIAKWHFDLTIDGKKQEEGNINFPITRTDGYGNVKKELLAPGTYGKFEVTVDSTTTEVGYRYDLAFTVENCPTNLIFYSKGEKVEKTENSSSGKKIATFTISKYVPLEKANGEFLETIYWEWPYETTKAGVLDDKTDTADSGKEVTLKIAATGTQIAQAPDGVNEVEDKVLLNMDKNDNKILSFDGYASNDDTEKELQNLNWKEFYKDNKGNTYLILDGYLPNELVPEELISKNGAPGLIRANSGYNINSSEVTDANDQYASRRNLIAKLGDVDNPDENTDTWRQLLPKDLRNNGNIVVAGTPTLNLWVESWNFKNDEKHVHLNTRYQKIGEGTNGIEGYLISTNATVSDTNYAQDGLDTTDKLYFPYSNTAPEQNCTGYWLASPSAGGTNNVLLVLFSGVVYGGKSTGSLIGVRPVVRIPTDIIQINKPN